MWKIYSQNIVFLKPLVYYGDIWRPFLAKKNLFLSKFLFFPIIKSFVFSKKLENLIQKFFVTKIQNPGSSSLTKVLTRDCLSLVYQIYQLIAHYSTQTVSLGWEILLIETVSIKRRGCQYSGHPILMDNTSRFCNRNRTRQGIYGQGKPPQTGPRMRPK